MAAVDAERGNPDVSVRSSEETILRQQIDYWCDLSLLVRYAELISRRRSDCITSEEYDELLALSERIEQANVERLESVGSLAALRGVTLPDMMKQLGIRPLPPERLSDDAWLVRAIRARIPKELRSRYQVLSRLLEDETISSEQLEEFQPLIDWVEMHNARRAELIVILAKLRGVSAQAIFEQLRLRPARHD